MALPTILVNSATGSDSLASGAGPSTALTGSNASTDGAGTTVTLDGSPDLTNVATDGSHVIYLADTTAGARNFGKITGKDNGAKTVTVSNAFGLSLSGKSWAIGGKRASIGSTTTRKLFENNSGNGDAMPGWIVEMESAHAETVTATIRWRRSGDTTDGSIILRGTFGAATKPLLTANFNGALFITGTGDGHHFLDFDAINTNATKTASIFLQSGSGGQGAVARGLIIGNSTNYFWKGFVSSVSGWKIQQCDVAYCANIGVDISVDVEIEMCRIHHCGSHGVALSGGTGGSKITRSVISNNGGDGVNYSVTGGGRSGIFFLEGCNLRNNTDDGFENSDSSIRGVPSRVRFNRFVSNGGYGINYSAASAAAMKLYGAFIQHNAFYSNTSGHRNTAADAVDENSYDLSSDPDVSSSDYNINDTSGGGADLRAATVTLP